MSRHERGNKGWQLNELTNLCRRKQHLPDSLLQLPEVNVTRLTERNTEGNNDKPPTGRQVGARDKRGRWEGCGTDEQVAAAFLCNCSGLDRGHKVEDSDRHEILKVVKNEGASVHSHRVLRATGFVF